MNELAKIEEDKVLVAFTVDNGLDEIIFEAKNAIDGFEHDLSTAAGRKRTASLAHKVAQLKTKLDGMGKELVSEWKQKAKIVDINRKKMRDELDALKADARQPLTEWENAEAKRVQDIREEIDWIITYAQIDDEHCSKSISERISILKSKSIDDSFEEFQSEAIVTRDRMVKSLELHLERVLKEEAQKAELERLKKEAEEREKAEKERLEKERLEKIEREAAEKARLEAERKAKEEIEKAERERIAAEERERIAKEQQEKAEREKKEAIERAERERIAAEERAKIEAEQAEKRRIEAEALAKKQAEEAAERARQEEIAKAKAEEERKAKEQEEREANKRHVGKIRREAKDSLLEVGVTEDQAKKIVMAIDQGLIANVTINY